MALTIEWRERIELWLKELRNHFYLKSGDIALRGAVTKAHLSPEAARKLRFRATPVGTKWGAKWEYGWFQGAFVVPETVQGRTVVLKADCGGEAVIWVDGAVAGARRPQDLQPDIYLADAAPGRKRELLIECYAGHGRRVFHLGPLPPDRESVPEPPPRQTEVRECSFGLWEEELYQLYLDALTLWDLRNAVEPESLRAGEVDEGLKDFTTLVDFEGTREELLAGARAARERLRPLLACVNGSTAPLFYCFGHAHLDLAWLWPLAETDRKAARTFANQLALMEQYPEYKFLQSQPHLYRSLERHYPELYARVKAAVRRGQWIPEGGMWIEADTNLSGGEALIRQFIHGKRFFRDEFGVDNRLLWLPDVFGYSGALPQIMRGCGIRHFSTAKIFWTYHGGDPFPHNAFTWEGIDGSEVLVFLCNNYNGMPSAGQLAERWKKRRQKQGLRTFLFPFGHGDGGGGPTRQHLEFLRRCGDLEGVPRTRQDTPAAFFQDLEKRGVSERYVGELYFQAHRGTYTSQSRAKRGNRKSELALREAELWGCAARALRGFDFGPETLDEAWKSLLLHQFHDILPGSSIARVYEQAEEAHANVQSQAEEVKLRAAKALARRAPALTVFNSLNWERIVQTPLPKGWSGAEDPRGRPLPAQTGEDGLSVEARVPACGWTTLRPLAGASAASGPDHVFRVSPKLLENDLLRVELNERAELVRIHDKETDSEWAAGPCNALKMYKDVPTQWDAWDLDPQYALSPVALDAPARIEVLAGGPLFAELRVTRRLNRSQLTQQLLLRRGSRRIEFHTVMDWRERHKLLKVEFPVNVFAQEAVHEIQFGHLRRPNHYSRPFDADRFEVCQHKWTALCEEARGCAVLNDCKYGVNVLGNRIALTLLKSPLAPDMRADQGRQEFVYAFYAWQGPPAQSALMREAYELNAPAFAVPGAAGERALFQLDAPNIILEAAKPSEDGSGDLVLRLYEAHRAATRCALRTSLPVKSAALCDMLETEERPLKLHDGAMRLDFRPFEIKTVLLKLGVELA